MREWIKVSDRLPEPGVPVIGAHLKSYGMGRKVRVVRRGAFWCECRTGLLRDITHWMPMPEDPKEDE